MCVVECIGGQKRFDKQQLWSSLESLQNYLDIYTQPPKKVPKFKIRGEDEDQIDDVAVAVSLHTDNINS